MLEYVILHPAFARITQRDQVILLPAPSDWACSSTNWSPGRKLSPGSKAAQGKGELCLPPTHASTHKSPWLKVSRGLLQLLASFDFLSCPKNPWKSIWEAEVPEASAVSLKTWCFSNSMKQTGSDNLSMDNSPGGQHCCGCRGSGAFLLRVPQSGGSWETIWLARSPQLVPVYHAVFAACNTWRLPESKETGKKPLILDFWGWEEWGLK